MPPGTNLRGKKKRFGSPEDHAQPTLFGCPTETVNPMPPIEEGSPFWVFSRILGTIRVPFIIYIYGNRQTSYIGCGDYRP